jgi:hypothetical protein
MGTGFQVLINNDRPSKSLPQPSRTFIFQKQCSDATFVLFSINGFAFAIDPIGL